VLVELNVVEQRYQAVLDVLAGSSVTEVAGRFGLARQTVSGCAGTAATARKASWMGRRSRCRARIRCRRRWSRGSWPSAKPRDQA
jgi:transposase